MSTAPHRAFFFLGCDRLGRFHGYPHLAIALAEGLRKLGWIIDSDVQAWLERPGGEFLFPGSQGLAPPAKNERIRTSDLIVVSEDWFFLGAAQLPKLENGRHTPMVFLDRTDLGARELIHVYGQEGRKADLVLRCHWSRFLRYPSNVRPWAFGLSERILTATREVADASPSVALWNFRRKNWPHTVREWAERAVKPVVESRFRITDTIDVADADATDYDELMLRQTEGRHFRSYYRRLAATTLCAAFGGWFLVPLPQSEAGAVCRLGRALLRRFPLATRTVAQWDSWRLWEAFAAGATVLHLDFERHGFLLPGPLPQPMVHYVPVDLRRPRASLEPILDDPAALRRIGEAGRAWALDHYSPTAMAQRLLADPNIASRLSRPASSRASLST